MTFYGRSKNITDLTLTQTTPVSEHDYIRLEIIHYAQSVTIPLHKRLILGRRDPGNILQPDVDLAPFAGYRNGVSRSHAWFRRSAEGYLEITDLGSSNGTYINDRRLSPHYSYVVHNGDKVKLGKLEMVVRYPGNSLLV